MTDPSDAETQEVEELLSRARPVPRPAFRGELRRHLLAGKGIAARPQGLRRLIAGYALSGGLLLVVAAVGLADIGPLAA